MSRDYFLSDAATGFLAPFLFELFCCCFLMFLGLLSPMTGGSFQNVTQTYDRETFTAERNQVRVRVATQRRNAPIAPFDWLAPSHGCWQLTDRC